MRIRATILSCIAGLVFSFPLAAQVVLNMPAPPARPIEDTPNESASAAGEISVAGYDTFDEEAVYAQATDVALIRYAGFRNFPRVTSAPISMYGGRTIYGFNGPWVYPPIWGGPFFFSNHGFFGGFRGPPVCLPHFGFGHFGGFHGHFRFGGDHFKGHVRIGF